MYKQNIFSIDALGASEYKGYHLPDDLWNGWENPLFEKDVAEQLVKDQKALFDQCGDVDRFEWDGDILIQISPEEEGVYRERVQQFTIEFEGEKKTVYPIGNHSWCWSAENNEYYDLQQLLKEVINIFGNEANYPEGTRGYNLAEKAKKLIK